MIRQRVLAAVVAFGLTVPLMHYWRGLAWSLSLLVGLALGAFGFLLVRAIHNLSAWRPRR